MSIHKQIFDKEINRIEKDIAIIRRIDSINNELHEFNWLYMHPYNQGFEIRIFEKFLTENKTDIADKIFTREASKFLDLELTIIFLEGFFKQRPFLKNYCQQIEESIILCIQKDFSGAINLIIPTIEGTLRDYLISKKGESARNQIKISDLSKAFDLMTDSYVELQHEYLKNQYGYLKESQNYFDLNQEKQILKKEREYFDLWINQLRQYLNNKLYLDTRKSSILKDNLNRNNIFHAFEQIDYSFNNYLRIFNCVIFLSWAIGVITKECSILSTVENEDVEEKFIEYLKILIISEATTNIKSKIFNRQIISFKPYLNDVLQKLSSSSKDLEEKFEIINELFKVK